MSRTIPGELTVEILLRWLVGDEESKGPGDGRCGAVHAEQVEFEDSEDDDVLRHVGGEEEVELRPYGRRSGEQRSDQVLDICLVNDGVDEGAADDGEVAGEVEGVHDACMAAGSDCLIYCVVEALYEYL